MTAFTKAEAAAYEENPLIAQAVHELRKQGDANALFAQAVREFREHGGTYGVALVILNAAYGKGKGGSND